MTAITIVADERKFRALVRNSIRGNVAMTRCEERNIENEFIRLAQKRPPMGAATVANAAETVSRQSV